MSPQSPAPTHIPQGTAVVRATGSDGMPRRLIYSGAVLCVDRSDKLSFSLTEGDLRLSINIDFSDKVMRFSWDAKLTPEGDMLDLTLHRWDDNQGVENFVPLTFHAKNGSMTVWVKIRTVTDSEQPWRTLYLAVWGEDRESQAPQSRPPRHHRRAADVFR